MRTKYTFSQKFIFGLLRKNTMTFIFNKNIVYYESNLNSLKFLPVSVVLQYYNYANILYTIL